MRPLTRRQIRFATNYFFDVGLYLPKLSMLAIYFQLFPGHDRPLRMALYFVTAFTISAALVTIFSDTFWCGKDVSVNWCDKSRYRPARRASANHGLACQVCRSRRLLGLRFHYPHEHQLVPVYHL